MHNYDQDTYSNASSKKGIPLWGKLLLACGIAILLVIASCAGFVAWGINSGYFSKKLETQWNQMAEVIEAIKSDEGAARLYAENKGLKGNYPTEVEFNTYVDTWRTKVVDFPITVPNFRKLVESDISLNIGADKSKSLRYRLPDGTTINLQWENEKLVDIDIR